MPSPFPGMDPWLESPDLWPDVHHRLIGVIGELLVPQLRPSYFVGVERRVYVIGEDDQAQRFFIPDLAMSDGPRAPRSQGGGAATASEPSAVLFMVGGPIEIRELRLVIRATTEDKAVVTVVEVLSPTNKLSGSRGREEYLAKMREVYHSPVHLVEIDLLRAGARIPSVQSLPAGDYYVHVSRSRRRPKGEIWAWGLRDAPPVVPIPVRDGDREALLDLGKVLETAYDRAGYDLVVDYGAPPDPPLRAEDVAWAAEQVARWRTSR